MSQLFNKLSIRDISLNGKRVLVRADLNVPLKEGVITSNYRILQALPTIEYAFEQKAHSVVVMSHLGRPGGKQVAKYSLAPVAADLQLHLPNRRVRFLNNCVGKDTEQVCQEAEEGDVILLENLRFHPEEEGYHQEEGKKASKNAIKKFRASLSKLGDVYVNDAFGTAHRSHASSVVGIHAAEKVAGLLMEKELQYFSKVLLNSSPERPFLTIIGGAKVSDKIQLIENMLDKVDALILCGAMAFPFLKVCQKMKIGKSLYDDNDDELLVTRLMEKAKEKNIKVLLPVDFITASEFSADPKSVGYATEKDGIPDDMMGLDCGQSSNELFHDEIIHSKTILWNGPPGVFELEKFEKGARAMLASIIEATEKGATTIIAGGDTATVITNWANVASVSHVSTGGGAALELLEGKELPGVSSLTTKK